MGGGTSRISAGTDTDNVSSGRLSNVAGFVKPVKKQSNNMSAPDSPTRSRKSPLHSRIVEAKPTANDIPENSVSRYTSESAKHMSPATTKLIKEALTGLNLLNDDNESSIIGSMERQKVSANQILIKKNDPGDCMYVVETGLLEVVIQDDIIRTMGAGSTLGELSLLYDAPRSATVRCITQCILWKLNKEVFQSIQHTTTSEATLRYARWLINVPEFAVFSALDLSTLVNSLHSHTYNPGDIIYHEGEITNQCILIDFGRAKLLTKSKLNQESGTNNVKLNENTLDIQEVLRQYMIITPKSSDYKLSNPKTSVKRTSSQVTAALKDDTTTTSTTTTTTTTTTSMMMSSPLTTSMSANNINTSTGSSNNNTISSTSFATSLSSKVRSTFPIKRTSEVDLSNYTTLGEIREGTFIGAGILRGKAKIEDSWSWNTSKTDKEGNILIGVECPLTIKAIDKVEALIFTIHSFESLFGHIEPHVPGSISSPIKVSSQKSCRDNTRRLKNNNLGNTDEKLFKIRRKIESKNHTSKSTSLKFNTDHFKQSVILGCGNYSVVTMGEFIPSDHVHKIEDTNDIHTNTNGSAKHNHYMMTHTSNTTTSSGNNNNSSNMYALKILSKADIIEMGQIRHVADEVKLLSVMSSPFIIKLYGTYQTSNEIVLVTELLSYGDLWSVIYESEPYKTNHGLSLSLTQFYMTNIISALSHMHDRCVVYRDLKPENILLDKSGYIKLIDFGYAKKVPYVKIDMEQREKLCLKTYTLCGTPEYMSPEMIFNMGHDHATDIWSLGVLLYEMIMSVTPFAAKRADNMTELLTNIALVKKNGFIILSEFKDKAGISGVDDLLIQLLQPEPKERIGVLLESTWTILQHKFFNSIDMASFNTLSLVPEYLPLQKDFTESVTHLIPTREYYGPSNYFNDF